jgi:carboxyl-terminal processing protease
MDDNSSKINNSKFKIYTPIVLALVLAAGIFIGSRISSNSDSNNFIFRKDPNKMDLLLDLIENNYVDTISRENLIEQSIPILLEHLDPHSTYIPAQDLKAVSEPLEGNFEGIGVQFNLLNDTVFIINTVSGGPSEKVGVKAGDKIVTINDSLFVGKKITSEMVIKKLKGEKDTKVKIGVKRYGFKDLLSFTITRDKIPLYSVDVAYMVDKITGYIKISTFGRTTHDEFLNAVSKLKKLGMQKMVLDLRSNGGGYMDAAIKIADEFLPDGQLIVYYEGKARPRADYPATSNGVFEKGDLSVLIDSWSASASEIVAGAIQDNDRGTIIGRRSFGKGLVQEPTFFRDGSAVRLTIARYYTPTGRSIQKAYNKGGVDYDQELLSRLEHGEFENADSTKFSDSLKFVTKKGKVVYGGGGIMPDVFVPLDTVAYTKLYRELARKAVIYNYALSFTEQNRPVLEKFTDYKQIVNFLNSKNAFPSFLQYASKIGINPTIQDMAKSQKIIKTYFYAYICRNILDNNGFYPVIKDVDTELLKAIEVLEKS